MLLFSGTAKEKSSQTGGARMRNFIAALLIISTLLIALSPLAALSAQHEYPHFIERNKARYEAYRALNPGLPYDIAIAYVNANVDKGFYNDVTVVKDPDNICVLVNKNFALPSKYEPADLVSISGYRLRAEAAEHFLQMRADMNSLGYKIHIMAAYRTYTTQAARHSNAVRSFGLASADRQFARAGHSEHQTGLAVDIVQRTNIQFMTQAQFEKTKEFAWLTENAHNYGFILRYPREYRDIHGYIFEPWHWRYVGVDIATTMYNEGITIFEEYYGWNLAPEILAKNNKGSVASLVD
jgi:D-alanyl-D-alanine carboxypeptidase